MDEKMLPASKRRGEPMKEDQSSGLHDNQAQNQQPNVDVAQSPVTEPMLMPEMWAKIFEYMSPDELETLINTTPEWNRLLHSQKTMIVFPKVLACMQGYLHWKDTLPFRLVNKACKTGVETAYPDIPRLIQTKVEEKRAWQEVTARIRLEMQREARNRQREAQGLPIKEVFDGGEEDHDREYEFSDEEINAFLRRRLPRFHQQWGIRLQ